MHKITPHLWFVREAVEAAEFREHQRLAGISPGLLLADRAS